MYKVITSFWSKTTSPNKQHLSTDNDDGWVFVSDGVMITPTMKTNNSMTNSWIATPPLIKNDESSVNVHHFNPIENLLIEHASMSVYEQIATKTRNRRHKSIVNNDDKLDEEGDDDDEDDRTSIDYQSSNLTSMLNQNSNVFSNSSVANLDSSLVVHHRHLNRLNQRRKRPIKPLSSKLISTTNIDDSKQLTTKTIERQRLNHSRTPKILIQESSRLSH